MHLKGAHVDGIFVFVMRFNRLSHFSNIFDCLIVELPLCCMNGVFFSFWIIIIGTKLDSVLLCESTRGIYFNASRQWDPLLDLAREWRNVLVPHGPCLLSGQLLLIIVWFDNLDGGVGSDKVSYIELSMQRQNWASLLDLLVKALPPLLFPLFDEWWLLNVTCLFFSVFP